jgi:hypothetical protein
MFSEVIRRAATTAASRLGEMAHKAYFKLFGVAVTCNLESGRGNRLPDLSLRPLILPLQDTIPDHQIASGQGGKRGQRV